MVKMFSVEKMLPEKLDLRLDLVAELNEKEKISSLRALPSRHRQKFDVGCS